MSNSACAGARASSAALPCRSAWRSWAKTFNRSAAACLACNSAARSWAFAAASLASAARRSLDAGLTRGPLGREAVPLITMPTD